MKYKNLLFIVFTLFHAPVFSLENKFNFLTAENGLTAGHINCIFQDHLGYLWIGGGQGLNRYDGYDVVQFLSNSEDSTTLSHPEVMDICEDLEGKIWLATNGNGISVFSPKLNQFKRITHVMQNGNKITLEAMNEIELAPDGKIWALDIVNGLYIFDQDLNIQEYIGPLQSSNNLLPIGKYDALTFDKKGNGWIGLGKGKVCSYQPSNKKFITITYSQSEISSTDETKVLFTSSNGDVWIGTLFSGAFKLNPETGVVQNYKVDDTPLSLTNNMIRSLYEDNEGNIIFGSDGGGLNILNIASDEITPITFDVKNSKSLNTNAVYAVFIDKSQTLWVGTYSGGVNYSNKYKNKFKSFVPNPLSENSLSFSNVTDIMENMDGTIWLGTDGGGINIFDPVTENFIRYQPNPAKTNWIESNVIIDLFQDSEGDIFYGTWAHGMGLYKKNEGKFITYMPNANDPNSIGGVNTWFIHQDSYGDIWVAILLGGPAVDKFDKATGTFKHYFPDPTDTNAIYLASTKVIYEDKNREVWFGSENGGLFKYNRSTDNFKRYFFDKTTLGSPTNDIRGIFEDSKNRFWVATANGLILLDRTTGNFERISTESGFPNKVINSILEDNNGILWIATNDGLVQYNPNDHKVRIYNQADGIPGNEFNYTSECYTSNGTMYFGTKKGFISFNPTDIQNNPNVPNIVFTDFQIFNQSIKTLKVHEGGHKIEVNPTTLSTIKLSYKQNVITFNFSALDYANPAKNQYKYMLEGFDKDWNVTSSEKRFATYTNLSGGTYTFRVIGSNGDDIWNEEGLSVKLIVTPPFWKTWWFLTILVVTILFLSRRYYIERQAQIKEDKRILEEKIQAGLQEVEKARYEVQLKDQALIEKQEQEKVQNWLNVGMAKFSDVISKNKDNVEILSRNVIAEVVDYLQIAQGAIYIYNDDSNEQPHLLLTACYAPDNDRLTGAKILLGEGQIGTAFNEQSVIVINNLPEKYATLSSGLGDAYLKCMAIVPLRLDEIVIGVMELLAFAPIDNYKIQFIEKIGENLTSMLTALRANEKTKKLLDQQKLQAEELSAQEEELRQNLEEMQATQEESARKADETLRKTKEFEIREKELSSTILTLTEELKKIKKK